MQRKVAERTDEVRRVVLRGRLDAAAVAAVELDFHAATSGGRDVIVDVSDLQEIAPVGVRLLVMAAQTLMTQGSVLVLAGASDAVAATIRDTGGAARFLPMVPAADAPA